MDPVFPDPTRAAHAIKTVSIALATKWFPGAELDEINTHRLL
jgi:hypothetical protein